MTPLSRRRMLQQSLRVVGAGLFAGTWEQSASAERAAPQPMVRTVLGPIRPDKLGVTLMHEHAPIVDHSELHGTPAAPLGDRRKAILANTARLLDAFHETLAVEERPGTVVETTPIRVGRSPELLVALAKQTKVHVVASTGFWCEAVSPQHPWALQLLRGSGGVDAMAQLFVREITQGMEDPSGHWNERFTNIPAGIIKIGTSRTLTESERGCHIAAAIASKETGCPVTTHTTRGGGLEEAEVLLKHGAPASRIIIGHQGQKDDGQHDEALEYHRQIAKLGCYVQFDRVSHEGYGIDKQARQIVDLIQAGYVKQVLVSHDHAPFVFTKAKEPLKRPEDWKENPTDYTLVTTALVASLAGLSVSKAELHTILLENPQRVLAF